MFGGYRWTVVRWLRDQMSGGAVVKSRDRRDRNRLDREVVKPLLSERRVCEEIMICSDNLDTPTDGSTQGGSWYSD